MGPFNVFPTVRRVDGVSIRDNRPIIDNGIVCYLGSQSGSDPFVPLGLLPRYCVSFPEFLSVSECQSVSSESSGPLPGVSGRSSWWWGKDDMGHTPTPFSVTGDWGVEKRSCPSGT